MSTIKPFVITFAGPPGTSKTPIALYLSHTLRLPVIQMDAIRMEVSEDLLIHDQRDSRVRAEFLKRAHSRYQPLLQEGVCFIDDSSADRSWKQQPGDQYYQLTEYGYNYFIISMDMSMDFITKLHTANGSRLRSALPAYYEEHQAFLGSYGEDVAVHITDDTFAKRMSVCETAVKRFLSQSATAITADRD